METTWIRKVTEVHWARVFLDRTEPVICPSIRGRIHYADLSFGLYPSPQVMLRTNTFRGKIPFVEKR